MHAKNNVTSTVTVELLFICDWIYVSPTQKFCKVKYLVFLCMPVATSIKVEVTL